MTLYRETASAAARRWRIVKDASARGMRICHHWDGRALLIGPDDRNVTGWTTLDEIEARLPLAQLPLFEAAVA